jgi:hypothetical protein
VANGVVVLGMHRSGTSAATRLVNLLGVPLSDEQDLLPPAFDNPRGHWESRSLVEQNDRLLAARGCDWTCPVRFWRGWESEPTVASLGDEAVATFRRVVTTDEWVWKDPRNCLLLPFWRAALDVSPVVVLVLRNPLEIAASLERRDRLEIEYGIALWERYMRVGLESIRGLRVLATNYDDILARPVEWCERARATLEAAGLTVSEASESDVREFVEPALKNERVAWEDVAAHPDFSASQRVVSRALRLVVGEHEAFVPPELPPEAPSTEELLAERRNALAALRQAMAASSP